jgi:hypothetical protein
MFTVNDDLLGGAGGSGGARLPREAGGHAGRGGQRQPGDIHTSVLGALRRQVSQTSTLVGSHGGSGSCWEAKTSNMFQRYGTAVAANAAVEWCQAPAAAL